MLVLALMLITCWGTGVHTGRLHRRQVHFGQEQGGTDIAGENEGTEADTRFFGLFEGLLGGGECACVTDGRKRRQTEVGSKFFFGGGSSACNCPESTPLTDCKGRPEGDTFYGCGCDGGGGAFFGIGRKKRQTRQGEENVNTRFLDFRCIGAMILGRKTR